MTLENHDLTKGSVIKMLLRFAVPFLLANILQSLYGAVDLFVIGKYGSPSAVAAVSTGTQVTQIVSSLISGLTVSSTVIIGNAVGRKDDSTVKKAIGTSFTGFFVVGLVITALMLLLQQPLLVALRTPESAISLASTYIILCSVGTVFICEYNAVSAILRGYGDSRSPLLFVGIACVLNILLDFVFVKYCHMDVAGTALATVLSQALSAISAVIYLKKKRFIFDFKKASLKPHKETVKNLIRIGIPVSFQELMTRISFLYIAFAMNRCGLYAAGIVGIGAKYDVFAMLTSTSLASALTAITAQNMGAEKPRRARKALFYCIAFSLTVSSLFFCWAQFAPESMISVFDSDSGTVAAGIPYFISCSYDYLMVALVFCLNGYLNGKGKTLWTMVSTVFSALVLRIPMTYLFIERFGDDLGHIGMIAPIVSAITAFYTLVYVIFEGKLHLKHTKTAKNSEDSL